MECVVPKRSLKIFAKVIQCLGKVGEELFLEPSPDKMVFRTLNQARSAFVAITFSPSFFEAYHLATDTVVSKCKIQLKVDYTPLRITKCSRYYSPVWPFFGRFRRSRNVQCVWTKRNRAWW